MRPPPKPEMRRGAAANDTPKSQSLEVFSDTENNQGGVDLQARRLRQLFFFAHDTARTVASLAWGISR